MRNDRNLVSRSPSFKQAPDPIAPSTTARDAVGRRQMRIAFYECGAPVRQLDSGNRDRRIVERLEVGHRGTSPFDRAMVLLNNIVEGTCRFSLRRFDVPPGEIRTPGLLVRRLKSSLRQIPVIQGESKVRCVEYICRLLARKPLIDRAHAKRYSTRFSQQEMAALLTAASIKEQPDRPLL